MPDKAGAPARAWQRMLSGRRLDLLDPSPLDVEIQDIAHGLARVARWNGQTKGAHAFSVAQHSVAVEVIFTHQTPKATVEEKLYALLHDGPEYVIGDMISPFKAVMGGAYKTIEHRLETAIHMRFGLPAMPDKALKAKVKKADLVCAYYEAIYLAGFEPKEADRFFGRPRGVTPDLINLTCMSAMDAETLFLNRFLALANTFQAA